VGLGLFPRTELQGDKTVQADVVSLVDDTHTTAAPFLQYCEMTRSIITGFVTLGSHYLTDRRRPVNESRSFVRAATPKFPIRAASRYIPDRRQSGNWPQTSMWEAKPKATECSVSPMPTSRDPVIRPCSHDLAQQTQKRRVSYFRVSAPATWDPWAWSNNFTPSAP